MNLVDYVVFYGAILSTITLGWNIYKHIQDRPKIKITTKFGFFNSFKDTEGQFLFVTAINKGKHSVYLSSFGLRNGKEDLIPNRITGIPCELKSGTSHYEFFKIDELKDRSFDFAWYRDATGRIYKSRSIKKKLNRYFKRDKNSLTQKIKELLWFVGLIKD